MDSLERILKRAAGGIPQVTEEEKARRRAAYLATAGIRCESCMGIGAIPVKRRQGDRIVPDDPWQPVDPDLMVVVGQASCPECGGRKETEEQAFARRLRAAVPMELWHMTFEEWKPEWNPAMKPHFRHVKAWAERPAGGLVLSGSNGVGKTMLAAAAAIEAVRHGLSARFFDTRSLLAHLRNAVGQGKGAFNAEYEFLKTTLNVFVLDELGGERSTEFGEDVIEDILSSRYIAERPFLVTTNVGPNEWGVRLTSRFSDKSRVWTLICAGDDVRPRLGPPQHAMGV